MPQSPKSAQFVAPIDQSERVLADGRVLVPGEPVDLDDDAQKDPHNARLIEEGQLLKLDQPTKSGGEE